MYTSMQLTLVHFIFCYSSSLPMEFSYIPLTNLINQKTAKGKLLLFPLLKKTVCIVVPKNKLREWWGDLYKRSFAVCNLFWKEGNNKKSNRHISLYINEQQRQCLHKSSKSKNVIIFFSSLKPQNMETARSFFYLLYMLTHCSISLELYFISSVLLFTRFFFQKGNQFQ